MTDLAKRSTIDQIPAIQKLFKPFPLASKFAMQFGMEFKSVTYMVPLSKYKNGIEVLHVTDTQQGHKLCNMKALTQHRDWVLAKPNRFMVWGGDMGDFGTKISVGSPWEQMFEPDRLTYEIAKFWAPARHRILGYVGGNHERRTQLTFGDAGLAVASMLGIPYSSGKQYVNIVYGAWNPFTIHLWHGRGTSSTAGAKMMLIDRTLRDEGDAHLSLIGHLHTPMLEFMARKRLQSDGTIKLIKCGAAMSSSFLEYWGGYGEVMNLNTAPLMMAKADIEPNGHWQLTLR
jgi:hypothetical protein